MIEVGDEKSYIHYAEAFIFRAQDFLRKKVGLEGEALLPLCERLEDHAFRRAIKENSPVSHNCIWMKKEAILHYHHSCQKMLRTIEYGDCDWKRTVEEGKGNIQSFYTTLMSEHFKYHVRKQSQSAAIPKPKVVRPVIPKVQKVNAKPPAPKKRKGGPGGVIPVTSIPAISVAASSSLGPATVADSAGVMQDDMGFEMGFFSRENSMLNENSLMSGGFEDTNFSAQPNTFNESAWTSVLASHHSHTESKTQTQVQTSLHPSSGVNSQWSGAKEELLQKQRREEESLKQQEIQRLNVDAQRHEQLQALRDQHEEAEKRREREEAERAERQRKLEEDRERARRELNEQKQTIYIDNAADKDELDEFINL